NRHRRGSDRKSCAFISARFAVDLGKIRAGRAQEGSVSRRQRSREQSRRRHLRNAELLRPGSARTADAAKRSEDARRPPNRVQICREFRSDAANSRTGRNLRRLDQTLEWSMTIITRSKAKPAEI